MSRHSRQIIFKLLIIKKIKVILFFISLRLKRFFIKKIKRNYVDLKYWYKFAILKNYANFVKINLSKNAE